MAGDVNTDAAVGMAISLRCYGLTCHHHRLTVNTCPSTVATWSESIDGIECVFCSAPASVDDQIGTMVIIEQPYQLKGFDTSIYSDNF